MKGKLICLLILVIVSVQLGRKHRRNQLSNRRSTDSLDRVRHNINTTQTVVMKPNNEIHPQNLRITRNGKVQRKLKKIQKQKKKFLKKIRVEFMYSLAVSESDMFIPPFKGLVDPGNDEKGNPKQLTVKSFMKAGKDEKDLKTLSEKSLYDKTSIEINYESGTEKYFWYYVDLDQNDETTKQASYFSVLAVNGGLVLSDVSNFNSKALYIKSVQYVASSFSVAGFNYDYIKYEFDTIAEGELLDTLKKKKNFFAFHYIQETQNITVKNEYNFTQTSSVFTYKHCEDCLFVGFKDRNDPVERNYGPFFEIAKKFMYKKEWSKFDVQELKVKGQISMFEFSGQETDGVPYNNTIIPKFFTLKVDEEKTVKYRRNVKYFVDCKIHMMQMNFQNFFNMFGKKIYSRDPMQMLKYRNSYYAYRTLDGLKFFFEPVDDKDIFDQDIQKDGHQVNSLTMKILTSKGIKPFDYDKKTRIIDMYDNFLPNQPGNDGDTKPKKYVPEPVYSRIWMVPLMYPFVRFKFNYVKEYWLSTFWKSIFSSEKTTPPTYGVLDYVLFDIINKKKVQDSLQDEFGKDNFMNMNKYLLSGETQSGIQFAQQENTMISQVLFDQSYCYRFKDNSKKLTITQTSRKVGNSSKIMVNVESDLMKTYEPQNSYLSIQYDVDYSYIEVWEKEGDDILNYCILQRQFEASQKRQYDCYYQIAPDSVQDSIVIDSDIFNSCLQDPVLPKYQSKTGKVRERKNNCEILNNLEQSSTFSYTELGVNANDKRMDIYKFSDGFQIYVGSKYKCLMNMDVQVVNVKGSTDSKKRLLNKSQKQKQKQVISKKKRLIKVNKQKS